MSLRTAYDLQVAETRRLKFYDLQYNSTNNELVSTSRLLLVPHTVVSLTYKKKADFPKAFRRLGNYGDNKVTKKS